MNEKECDRIGSMVFRAVGFLPLIVFSMFHAATAEQEGALRQPVHQSPKVSAPVAVRERPLELSGCAVVDGGLLIVEDELVGTILHVSNLGEGPLDCTPVKLERKKKERAPFAAAAKLFPVQDFEDIASNGNDSVYVIGSHQGKDGERRPDREFLIQATWEKKDGELKVRGEHYRLLEQISPALSALGVNIGLTRTEVSPELNIEGLALHGELIFVGLRSPLTADGQAIVLTAPVSDIFGSLANTPWVAHTLALGGAGIRALDWDPVLNALLVLAGPPGDGRDGPTGLWRCDERGEKLQSLLTFPPEIARKAPEGICRLPDNDGGTLLVVLDGDGSGSGGGDFVHVEL